MKARVMLLILAATLLGSAGASLAQSPDFTLTVPLRLTTLPARFVGGEITCHVLDAENAFRGSARQQFAVDPNVGTLSRDFVFNIRSTIHPSHIRSYQCSLALGRDIDGRQREHVPSDDVVRQFPGSTAVITGAVPR